MSFYQWAANGRQRSRWKGRCFRSRWALNSFSLIEASMYTKRSHRNTVGTQKPFSVNRNSNFRKWALKEKGDGYLCARHTGPRRRCWLQRTANEPGWTESKSCRTWWQCKWRILRMPAKDNHKLAWSAWIDIMHALTNPWYLNES